MTKKTKIKIRKGISFARGLFLVLFGICITLVVVSIDSESLVFPLVCFGIGIVCFGISYALDWLLFETAWSGDKKSPFNR